MKMKKILGFILMVVLAVAVYIPCREFAIMERGNTAYGGEVLVPVLVFLTYIVVMDYFSAANCNKTICETKSEQRRKSTDSAFCVQTESNRNMEKYFGKEAE